MNLLRHVRRLLDACPGEVDVVETGERRTGGDGPVRVVDEAQTIRHGVLEHALIPAVHEVAVEAVARWVALREGEFAALALVDVDGPVEHLEEQQGQDDWV